jgi:AcrR family transcriptional regulator
MATAAPCSVGATSRAELRRRKVTDTARKLFVEHGFHATGMAQIASESGVAVGQIYRDFSAKEDIVAALVETDCSRLMTFEVLEEAIRAADVDAVRTWLRDFVEPGDCMDDARLFAEIVAEASRNARVAAIFGALQARLRRHLLAALELLTPGAVLARRRAVLADAIMTLSLGLFHQQLMCPKSDLASVTRAVQAVLDRELAALAAA